MKKFILVAAIVFTSGIVSTFTTSSKSAKTTTIKISAVAFGLRNDLATAD